MPFSAAVLDSMLKATGSPVVFGGVASSTPVYGKLRNEEAVELDDSGVTLPITRTTLLLRDGSQPATWKEGALLTVAGVGYRLRDPGVVQPDGLRKAIVVRRV